MTDYKDRSVKSLGVLSDDKKLVVVSWSKAEGVYLDIDGQRIGPLSEGAIDVLKIALRDAKKAVF